MIDKKWLMPIVSLVNMLMISSAIGQPVLSYHDGCDMSNTLSMFDVEDLEVSVNDFNYTLLVKLCERQRPFIGLLNPEPVTHGLWINYDSDNETGISWPDYRGIDHEIYTLTTCNRTRCMVRTCIRIFTNKKPIDLIIGEKTVRWAYSKEYSLELPAFILDSERSRFVYVMVNSFRDEISRQVRQINEKLLEINDAYEKLPIDVKTVRILMLYQKLVINYTFYSTIPSLNEGGVVCWLPTLYLGKRLVAPVFWITHTTPYNLTGVIFLNFTKEPAYQSHLYNNIATYKIDVSGLRVEEYPLRFLPIMVCHVYDVVPDKGWLSLKNEVHG